MKNKTLLLVFTLVVISWVNAPETSAQTSPPESEASEEGGSSEQEDSSERDGVATSVPGLAEHLEALTSPDPAVRYRAVVALGYLRMASVVPHLARVLRVDPSADIRGWAIRSLAQIDTAEAREAIVEATESDSDVRVREMALEACRACAPSPFETPIRARRPSAVQQTNDNERARSRTLTIRSIEERRRGTSTLAIGVVLGLTSIIPLGVAGGLSGRWEDCSSDIWGGEICERTSMFNISMALFALGGLELCLSIIPMVLGARRIRQSRTMEGQPSRSNLSGLRPQVALSNRGGIVLGLSGQLF